MIIGKLIKPCKICIYNEEERGGEIESFSLLKLSLQETVKLLELTKEKETCLDGSITIRYSGNDSIHKQWKTLAIEHAKRNPKEFLDVSAKFKSDITGTSCLIRDPIHHIIKIALRRGNDKITINRICIDNSIRERFFNDVKACILYKETGRFQMDTKDLDVYTYWSKFMNTSYIGQYGNYKQMRAK